MAGKIRKGVADRWGVLYRVYWRPLVAVVAAVYAVIGLTSTLSGEFASERVQKAIRLGNFIPHLSPWIWATIGLALLLLLGIEGSYRENRRLQAQHAGQMKELEQERDADRAELEAVRREMAEAEPASLGQADMGRLAEDFDRLSRQINEYRAERTRGQPGYRFPTAKTEDGRHKQWVNNQDENEKYRNETSAGFQQKFATDNSRLWHAANEAGLVGEDDFLDTRIFVDHDVVPEPGMGRVAAMFAELGRRAKARQ